MTIQVLLVDDHPVVRAGLHVLLESETGLEVVGEAESGGRPINLTRALRPDVGVSDLRLPDVDGIGVTQVIRQDLPDTQVIILTIVCEEDLSLVRAIRAGGHCTLLKRRSNPM